MRIKLADEIGPYLTRAARAEVVLRDTWNALSNGEMVVLDFERVQQMTPSFANQVVFGLMSRSEGDFESLVSIEHAEEHILDVIRHSADRKRRGIDLTAYTIA